MTMLLSVYVITVAFYNFLMIPGVIASRPPWIAGLSLVGWAVCALLWRGWMPRPGLTGLALCLFALVTVANSVVVAADARGSWVDYLRGELQFALVFSVVWAFVQARLSEVDVGRMMRLWVWTAVLAAAYGVYQVVARAYDLPLAYLPIHAKGFEGMVVKQFFDFFAASSWFAEPSWFGSFLLVPVLYVGGVAIFDIPPPLGFRRATAVGLGLFLVLGLVLSLSLAAYASLVVAGAPLLWSARHHMRRTALSVLAIIVLVIGATVLVVPRSGDLLRSQQARIRGLVEALRAPETASQITSYGVRRQSMQTGIEIWKDNPYFGVGINNTGRQPLAWRLSDPESGSVSSGMLQLLVEQGLAGLGTLLFFLLALWLRLRRIRGGQSDPARRFLLSFLVWGLAADIANSMFTHPWYHPQRWLIISLALSFAAFLEAEVRRPAPEVDRPQVIDI